MVVPRHIARADLGSVRTHYGHLEVFFSGTFSKPVYTLGDNIHVRFTYVTRSPSIFTVAHAPASHYVRVTTCVLRALSAAETDPGNTSNACPSVRVHNVYYYRHRFDGGRVELKSNSREIHGFYSRPRRAQKPGYL